MCVRIRMAPQTGIEMLAGPDGPWKLMKVLFM